MNRIYFFNDRREKLSTTLFSLISLSLILKIVLDSNTTFETQHFTTENL